MICRLSWSVPFVGLWALTAQATSFVSTPSITSAPTPVATSIQSPPTPAAPVTTAPIYLPYYDRYSWSAMRGSIITSDNANKTTYTIFCPTQSADSCNLAIDFPFILVEGPKTVQFHGTYTSTFIANIECALDARTAATCSGYSSLKSGYHMGHQTGPTEIRWTSTFSGSAVQWGVLTLAEAPTSTHKSDALDAEPTNLLTSTALFFVPETRTSSGSIIAIKSPWMIVAAIACSYIGTILL